MTVSILIGDVRDRLRELPSDHFDCVVTSPPYWGLRSYLDDDHPDKPREIGLEPTLGEHLGVLVDLMREVRRVLKPTGVVWLNYGDCYATTPNGRSAADTKALGQDDRTFRDKPFSTVGPIYAPARGGPPSPKSTLRGSGHLGGGPKAKALTKVKLRGEPCYVADPRNAARRGKRSTLNGAPPPRYARAHRCRRIPEAQGPLHDPPALGHRAAGRRLVGPLPSPLGEEERHA